MSAQTDPENIVDYFPVVGNPLLRLSKPGQHCVRKLSGQHCTRR